MRLIGNLILGLFVVGIVSSCSHTSVYKFNPMENMPQGDTVSLDMDLKNAVLEGIVIPSKNQTTSGFFTF